MTRPLHSDKGGAAWWRAPGVVRLLVSFNVEWAGLNINMLTLGYLVHERSDSAFWLAVQVAAFMLPYTVVSVPGGLAGDLLGHRRALLILFALELGLTASLFAVEAGSGELAPWLAVAASLVLGSLAAAQQPSFFALLGEGVPESSLRAAITVNSSAASIASAIGVVGAGILIGTVGAEWVFAVAACLTVQVLVVLGGGLRARGAARVSTPAPTRAAVRERLTELRTLLRAGRDIRSAIIVTLVVGALALPLMWLLPVIAHWAAVGPGVLGALWGALFAGAAAVGPIAWLARRRSARPSFVVGGAILTCGLLFVALAVAGASLDGEGRILAVIGAVGLYGLALWLASSLLLVQVQTLARPGLAGSAVAVFEIAFDGVLPVAILVWGASMDTVGVTSTLVGAGTLLIAALALLAGRRRLRSLDAGDATTRAAVRPQDRFQAARHR